MTGKYKKSGRGVNRPPAHTGNGLDWGDTVPASYPAKQTFLFFKLAEHQFLHHVVDIAEDIDVFPFYKAVYGSAYLRAGELRL